MNGQELLRAATHAQGAAVAASDVQGLVSRAATVYDRAALGPLLAMIAESAERAQEGAQRAAGALRHHLPPEAPDLARAVDFHLLDTPDVRALAAGLRELLPLAERIDAARGRALAEVVGGSAGLDLAEDLAQMVARLELEAYGPAASVTGGRE